MLPAFQWMIENSIGDKNKLVMMDVKGNFRIFNESQGVKAYDCWFSNNTFISLKQNPCQAQPTTQQSPCADKTPSKKDESNTIDADITITPVSSNAPNGNASFATIEKEFASCDLDDTGVIVISASMVFDSSFLLGVLSAQGDCCVVG